MPPSLLRPLCWILLAGTWVLDVLTPQLFIAAVFFNVPIALSSLVLDARLTYWLVAFALTADASAGYVDGVLDHHHWLPMASMNRTVAAFSFLLVGVLSIAAQRSARLERSEVIRDIVYALSHDLRTPLAAASMTMRQALDGCYGELPASYRSVLERTVQSNDELRRLAETLLLVSRYESGDGSCHREPIELHAAAQEIVRELEPLWHGKGVPARVEGAEVSVLADRGELRRAVINLVANAVHWTPAQGYVTVRTVRDGRSGCVLVEDTGFGVPENLRERLFQRVGAESRHGAGSGLGLYIVRRIAEGHGGRVAYAPREGGGSVFRLELPLVESEL